MLKSFFVVLCLMFNVSFCCAQLTFAELGRRTLILLGEPEPAGKISTSQIDNAFLHHAGENVQFQKIITTFHRHAGRDYGEGIHLAIFLYLHGDIIGNDMNQIIECQLSGTKGKKRNPENVNHIRDGVAATLTELNRTDLVTQLTEIQRIRRDQLEGEERRADWARLEDEQDERRRADWAEMANRYQMLTRRVDNWWQDAADWAAGEAERERLFGQLMLKNR